MRILLVTPLVPSMAATTGGAIVMDGVLRVLAERHEVTLATLAAERTDAPALERLRDAGIDVHAVPVWRGGGVRGLRRQASFGVSWLWTGLPLRACAFWLPAFQRMLDALSRRTFDLIQVEDIVMGVYRYPAGIPGMLTDHDPGVADLTRLERSRWSRLQRRVWPRFDRIQTFTDMDAERIRAVLPEVARRVRVNPFGVTPQPLMQDPQTADRITFVGGFRHPPNVDAARWLCSDIMPRVRAVVPSARLTIVGADPPPAVRALAGPGVEVTGRVPSPAPYLAAATVVVAPLRQGGGMRVKVLEAMAAGKAVVSTSLAARGIANGAAPQPLRLADDAEGIAAAIVELLTDPAERARVEQAGRAHAAEFLSWQRFGRRLETIHRELLDSP